MAPDRRRLAAIMFTDIVGYSAIVRRDESAALRDLERHNRLLRGCFDRHRGREVKTVGDAFLVEFASALEAARCAVEIQEKIAERSADSRAPLSVRVRIGIHVGDVVERAGDLFGDAVNLASRIHALAEPGGICISQQVCDQVAHRIDRHFVRLPPTPLKNIADPPALYRLEARPSSSAGDGGTDHRALAVLPLSNISPDPQDAYFADGLTEEIIATLSQVKDLRVTARTSVAPYKAAPKSIAEVGTELGVGAILEGSVRKSGNRLRITLQLVDVPTQRPMWTTRYDREIGDVFAVQSDVAERTADALRLQLTEGTGPAAALRRPTESTEAYDLYLRGLAAADARELAGLERAIDYYRRATTLDPNFAEAYAAWADQLVGMAGDSHALREVMPQARELADRALRLDPDLSDAHTALGNIAMQFDHDWAHAETELRRAIALNPSNVGAYRVLAMLFVPLGRFDEAIEELRIAGRLDPGGGHLRSIAWALFESGRGAEAIAMAEDRLARAPDDLRMRVQLALMYVGEGRSADAQREARALPSATSYIDRFDFALIRALVGEPAPAQEILRRTTAGRADGYTSDCDLAMLYAALGDRERALEALVRDTRDGDRMLWLYARGVFFDSIRDDPRFQRLLAGFALPTPARSRQAVRPVSPRGRTAPRRSAPRRRPAARRSPRRRR